MRKQKKKLKIIALERVKELFRQADLTKDISLANRYVTLARRIIMRYRIKLPRVLKRRFCKYCYKHWKPGKTVRIRLLKGRKVYYCVYCKRFTRIPYKS